jgi:hypothetical protein
VELVASPFDKSRRLSRERIHAKAMAPLTPGGTAPFREAEVGSRSASGGERDRAGRAPLTRFGSPT